jgi:hypothetical protein
LCREEALELSSLKTFLDSRVPPVRLIAVAGEHLGHQDWQTDGQYWKGELFFDLGKTGLFNTMGSGKQGLLSGVLSYSLGGAVATNLERANAKGVSGNLKGEGFKLGGVWALSPEGAIAYEHKEGCWGDTVHGARLEELKTALSSFARP